MYIRISYQKCIVPYGVELKIIKIELYVCMDRSLEVLSECAPNGKCSARGVYDVSQVLVCREWRAAPQATPGAIFLILLLLRIFVSLAPGCVYVLLFVINVVNVCAMLWYVLLSWFQCACRVVSMC